jgi:hypothetical protein
VRDRLSLENAPDLPAGAMPANPQRTGQLARKRMT